MASVGHCYRYWQLPFDKIQQDVTISGRIDNVDQSANGELSRYIVSVVSMGQYQWKWPRKIRVTWSSPSKYFLPGQQVVLRVRLKPAFGTVNPHTFNYHQWLVSQKIVATGYVKEHHSNRLIEPNISLRHRLIYRLKALELKQLKWIEALIFGERGGFDKGDWELLKNTGTAHLFAISGLHIGIVLGWIWLVARLCIYAVSSLHPKLTQSNSLTVTKVLALSGGGFFVVMAGAQLPVVRAFVLATIAVYLLTSRQRMDALAALVMMAFICLLLFPFAVYGQSFYLSFSAVSAIWLLNWWLGGVPLGWRGRISYAIKMQVGLFLFMLPVVASFTGTLSYSALLTNLVLIPLFTIVIVPATSLLLVFLFVNAKPPALLLEGVDTLLHWVIEFLRLFQRYASSIRIDLSIEAALLAIVALALIVLPIAIKRRYLAVLFAFVTALLFVEVKRDDMWYLHIFDVGQGNSAAIQRGSHFIVFDTGASSRFGPSHAERTIIPFIQSEQEASLDYLFLSHYDDDHAGGAEDILAAFPDANLISPSGLCRRGFSQQWRGLNITALWPNKDVNHIDNNQSCVLSVSDNINSILLPGDIEQASEWQLVRQVALKSDVLIASHHGSKTSSTYAFLQAVSPQYAVLSYGFKNRYMMPDPNVINRLSAQPLTCLSTVEHGYIKFTFSATQPIAVDSMKRSSASKWFYPKKSLPCSRG